VADLAALRCADTADFAVGPRGHVVVEQEVLVGSGSSVSRSWFIFGIARVATLRTWVSPRWNKPVP